MRLLGFWPALMGVAIMCPVSMCEVFSHPSVRVWDNVVSKESLQRLLTAGDIRKHSLRTVIDREEHATGRTAIESIVISALEELEDDTRYVEYWWRDTWMNLPAHRDIDEDILENAYKRGYVDTSRYYRIPRYGHVLYVNIDAGLLAPTCLWEEGNISSFQTPESHPEHLEQIGLERPQESFVQPSVFGCPHLQQMYVVPAVPGRLLRFRGDLLHAAPKPADVYFDADQGPGFFAVMSDLVWPSRRVSLAFNTWDEPPSVEKGQPEPSQQELDAIAPQAGMPRCEGFAQWHALLAQRLHSAQLSPAPMHAHVANGADAVNVDGDFESGSSSVGEPAAMGADPTQEAEQEPEERIVVKLLGNFHRRGGCSAKAATAVGDTRALHAALRSSRAWHAVSLRDQTRAEARRQGQGDAQLGRRARPSKSGEAPGASGFTLLSLPFWLLALLWPMLVLPPVILFSKSPMQTSVTVLLLGMVLAKRFGLYDMDDE